MGHHTLPCKTFTGVLDLNGVYEFIGPVRCVENVKGSSLCCHPEEENTWNTADSCRTDTNTFTMEFT